MADERTILDMFGVDLTFLTDVVKANPSLRGIIIGYLAERKLWEFFWPDDPAQRRITAIRKDDDHDRESKCDLVVTYQGFDFRIEVKSLQTNSIEMYNPATKKWMKKVLKMPQPKLAGRKRQRNKWQECELYRTLWKTGESAAHFRGKVQCRANASKLP